MISDFSKQIKEGTKKSHSMAENTSFVASFLRGVIDQKNYRQLVANFYFIYHELETEVDNLHGLRKKLSKIVEKILIKNKVDVNLNLIDGFVAFTIYCYYNKPEFEIGKLLLLNTLET